MNKVEAHDLLDAAIAGVPYTEAQITLALEATGDLQRTHERRELIRTAARTLLSHVEAGRYCDPLAVDWAVNILRTNG